MEGISEGQNSRQIARHFLTYSKQFDEALEAIRLVDVDVFTKDIVEGDKGLHS